jgi:alkylhydroperoxidase/carboxymuconolactone decarboxylase family protein YurZ
MISLSPQLNKQFTAFANEALEHGALCDRERAIAILTAAIALENSDAVRQAIMTAKQVGISNEEIGHLTSVVVALRGQIIARLGFMTSANGAASTTQESRCCR